MNPRLYYHASKSALEPGTVLQARFGVGRAEQAFYNILRSALREGDSTAKALLLADAVGAVSQRREMTWPMYLKEHFFDEVRRSEFPQRPARLGGIFVCSSLEDLKAFRKQEKGWPYVYACHVEGGAQAELDLAFVSTADPLALLCRQREELEEKARRYWTGDRSESPVMEVVTNNAKVTILEALP